jgi:hypothetical protein
MRLTRDVKMGNVPQYENPQLQQRIVAGRNRAQLDLSSSQLTDQDMEIVAEELKTNTVRHQ